MDSRKHNAQNEITEHKVGTGQDLVKPKISGSDDSYDLEGNLLEVPFDNADAESEHLDFVYDAWNRLVAVKDGATVLAEYERDGIGRIIVNETTNEHYFYSVGWQVLSVFDTYDLLKENIWGVRYIDELAARITYDSDADRQYYMQDTNWNVVMMLDNDAAEKEHIRYDSPYGRPHFYFKYAGNWYDNSDFTSSKGSDVLFQGRWYETFEVSGNKMRLYHFRHRAYNPEMGRFLQRDPIGVWADGINLGNAYGFVGNGPLNKVDPEGKNVTFTDAMAQIANQNAKLDCDKKCKKLNPKGEWFIKQFPAYTLMEDVSWQDGNSSHAYYSGEMWHETKRWSFSKPLIKIEPTNVDYSLGCGPDSLTISENITLTGSIASSWFGFSFGYTLEISYTFGSENCFQDRIFLYTAQLHAKKTTTTSNILGSSTTTKTQKKFAPDQRNGLWCQCERYCKDYVVRRNRATL